MRIPIFALCLGLAMFEAQAAQRWQFADRVAVSGEPVENLYHHLDGAGRKHLAISAQSVAAVWEDNRTRDPQIYVAVKPGGQAGFAAALRVSSGGEAFEPAIASLGQGRFALAWEQDGAVYARLLNAGKLFAPLRLSSFAAGHVSLATWEDRIFAAWREQREGEWYLLIAALRVTAANGLTIDSRNPVESAGIPTEVLFPTLVASDAGLCIAWEDRRAGHTRLLVSQAPAAAAAFSPPRALNEFFSERNPYDQGNGVTRVSMASFGEDEIVAAWMDKRRGSNGYGIYAALGAQGGQMFGPNEKVHGERGDRQPHYNPATAGNAAGDFVVAWDDFRNGDSDVWISAYDDSLEWSADFSPPVASGAGEQSQPAIALDERGGLHLMWMERSDLNAPSRLWYSYAAPP
jgi:hypothetical protein